jgi:hypothetical protein
MFLRYLLKIMNLLLVFEAREIQPSKTASRPIRPLRGSKPICVFLMDMQPTLFLVARCRGTVTSMGYEGILVPGSYKTRIAPLPVKPVVQ